MYGECSNGKMTQIKLHNIDFIEDDYPSLDKVKKNLKLYTLQKEVTQSLNEDREFQTHSKIAKDSKDDFPLVGLHHSIGSYH